MVPACLPKPPRPSGLPHPGHSWAQTHTRTVSLASCADLAILMAAMQACNHVPRKEPAGRVGVCTWATWGPTLGLASAEV